MRCPGDGPGVGIPLPRHGFSGGKIVVRLLRVSKGSKMGFGSLSAPLRTSFRWFWESREPCKTVISLETSLKNQLFG